MESAAAAQQAAVRQQKLDILERLLWATDFGGGAIGASPEAAGGLQLVCMSSWNALLYSIALLCSVSRAQQEPQNSHE